jgi:hypothetical protein
MMVVFCGFAKCSVSLSLFQSFGGTHCPISRVNELLQVHTELTGGRKCANYIRWFHRIWTMTGEFTTLTGSRHVISLLSLSIAVIDLSSLKLSNIKTHYFFHPITSTST